MLAPPKMASSEAPEREPPRKRQRLSPPPPPPSTTSTTQQPAKNVDKMEDQRTKLIVSDNGFQPERETEVGILHFVNTSNPGFSGTLKQRYVSGRVPTFRFGPRCSILILLFLWLPCFVMHIFQLEEVHDQVVGTLPCIM